jgi:hypothetical protein
MKKHIYEKHNEVLYQQQQQLSQDFYKAQASDVLLHYGKSYSLCVFTQNEIARLNQLLAQYQHTNQRYSIVIERLVYHKAEKAAKMVSNSVSYLCFLLFIRGNFNL